MLTLTSDLSVTKVSKKALAYTGTEHKVHVTVGTLAETEAYLLGETCTPSLLDLCEVELHECNTKIHCKDGLLEVPLHVDTLARHFHLFRNYFTEYPEEGSITIPTLLCSRVEAVLDVVIEGEDFAYPLADLLYTLQTLDPRNNLSYFLFDLSGMEAKVVSALLSHVTEDERYALLEAHRINRGTPLPDHGRGACLLVALERGREYLASLEGASLLPNHPSWLFMNASRHEDDGRALQVRLIEEGFDKPEYCFYQADDILVALADCLKYCNVGKICSMMGVQHPKLSTTHHNAPYQLEAGVTFSPLGRSALIIFLRSNDILTKEEVMSIETLKVTEEDMKQLPLLAQAFLSVLLA